MLKAFLAVGSRQPKRKHIVDIITLRKRVDLQQKLMLCPRINFDDSTLCLSGLLDKDR